MVCPWAGFFLVSHPVNTHANAAWLNYEYL